MSPLRVSLVRTANYCVLVVFLLESLFVDLNGCILFCDSDISYFIAVTTVTLGIAINLLLLVHDRKLWLTYTAFIFGIRSRILGEVDRIYRINWIRTSARS